MLEAGVRLFSSCCCLDGLTSAISVATPELLCVWERCVYAEVGLCEGGVDAAEVGFAVADAEGEVVDVGDARAGVGVSALREWHVLVGGGTLALLPGLADRSRQLAAVRVIDVGTLTTAMVVAVEHCELGAVNRAQILDRDAQHHRHHDINFRLCVTTILRATQRRIYRPLRTNRTLVIALQNR